MSVVNFANSFDHLKLYLTELILGALYMTTITKKSGMTRITTHHGSEVCQGYKSYNPPILSRHSH
jgi:hypothetical protein